MSRAFVVGGALSAAIAVMLGAFAAHGLRSRLTPELASTFEVAVRYQMYHALGLFAVAWAAARWPGGSMSAAGILFIVGTLIFSGSLYLLVLTGQKWLGAITPLGGLAFIVGWLLLAWGAWTAGA
jgi:uncharacterized membrane protein YgdD (TMEM256/DUF423 family)